MENSIEVKKKIHHFIDNADQRILNIIYAIIKTEENQDTLEARIIKAREEKEAGTLKIVDPKDIWKSIQ